MNAREEMRNFLRIRYNREPTEQEIDSRLQIYEVDHSRLRSFFRKITRIFL